MEITGEREKNRHEKPAEKTAQKINPEVFHCDDVPRQTISSAAPELASLTKTLLAMSNIHRGLEKRWWRAQRERD